MADGSATKSARRPKMFGEPCTYCRRAMTGTAMTDPLRATRDHYYPRSKNKGLVGNIVYCCFFCNQVKGDRSPEEWQRFMKRNPEFWTHPYFTGRPKIKQPVRIKAKPLEETRAFLREAALRTMTAPPAVPKEYEDPDAQRAFELTYRGKLHLLRIQKTTQSLTPHDPEMLAFCGLC